MNRLRNKSLKLINYASGRPKLLAGFGVLVFLALALALAANNFFIHPPVHAASNANTVLLSYNHTVHTLPTQAKTVGELLDELKIKIHKGDVVEPALDARINQDKFRINIYRARPVVIVDGDHKTYSFSAAASPRAVAEQAGIKVFAEDQFSVGPVTDFAQDNAIGEKIVIDRATPVNLMLYGHTSTVRTHAKTVADLIKQKNISLKAGDTLTPTPSTPLTSGMTIALNHKGVKFITETKSVPAPVKYIADASLSIGTSAVRQQGSDGQQEITYKIITKNGQEVSRENVQKVIIQDPVEKIIVRGTAIIPIPGNHRQWMNDAGISAVDQPYADYIISRESGWCPTKWQGELGGCPAYHGTPSSPYVGYGLCQSTPGYKMQSAGSGWAYNPVTQLKWCSGYAADRYGSWYNAYVHWVNYTNW